MSNAIGLRFYLITLSKRGSSKPIPFSSVPKFSIKFVEDFIKGHKKTQDASARLRSWYFEPKAPDPSGQAIRGIIRYGTYGYESDLVDTKTRKTNYKRQTSDTEQIPLYFEFTFDYPDDKGYAVFQSFAGKSCVNLVISALEAEFERKFKGYRIRLRKLMPSDSKGSVYGSRPVKRLTLIKKGAGSDIAARYAGLQTGETVNLEISLTTGRRSSFGSLSAVTSLLPKDAAGIVLDDGTHFDEASAEVTVGKRRRKVTIYGLQSDAGVIDISEDVKLERGHPTFESVRTQVRDILEDLHTNLSEKKV